MTFFIPSELSTVATNEISDGQYHCTYSLLHDLIAAMAQHLESLQLDPTTPLIFGCDNTLSNALLLLTLLENNYHFLIVPEPALKQGNLPHFCPVLLHCATTTPAETPLAELPNTVMVQKNPDWQSDTHFSADQPSIFLRTSGSTGRPKLVQHSHQALRNNAQHCVERLGLTSQARVAIPVPLFHMYGLGAAFLPSIRVGAAINLQKGANLLRYMQHEREFNPNIAFMTPVFCESLRKGRRSPRPYQFTVVAGDRLRADSFHNYQAFFGPLIQLYGSTEMGALAAADTRLTEERRAMTAGCLMPDVSIRFAASEAENEAVNSEETGRPLWCKRDCGFTAYVDFNGRRLPNHETFDAEGWFFTKDRAIYHDNKYLELTGRTDNCINRDGLLVAFSEVEKVIEQQAMIDKVVVLSQGESQRGKKLIAFCTLMPKAALTSDDIRQHCCQHLPLRAVPDEIKLITEFPLLPNGKVDHQTLGQW